MPQPLKLLCVLAHPDDESLGTGGILAKYAAEGIETYLITATKGEKGRFGDVEPRPAPEIVGRERAQELQAAAGVLGLKEVNFLGYCDGALDQADPVEIQTRIADHLLRIRPQVVVTFGPDGAYGHPDHIAISQFTTAAVLRAAGPSHRVDKLYYLAWSQSKWAAYQAGLKTLVSRVDNEVRQATPWPDWAITTVIDTTKETETVWEAVSQHKTQMSIYKNLNTFPGAHHQALWGSQEFYRAFSSVNGGRQRESDLFEGLR